jgi:hypothetical protein
MNLNQYIGKHVTVTTESSTYQGRVRAFGHSGCPTVILEECAERTGSRWERIGTATIAFLTIKYSPTDGPYVEPPPDPSPGQSAPDPEMPEPGTYVILRCCAELFYGKVERYVCRLSSGFLILTDCQHVTDISPINNTVQCTKHLGKRWFNLRHIQDVGPTTLTPQYCT